MASVLRSTETHPDEFRFVHPLFPLYAADGQLAVCRVSWFAWLMRHHGIDNRGRAARRCFGGVLGALPDVLPLGGRPWRGSPAPWKGAAPGRRLALQIAGHDAKPCLEDQLASAWVLSRLHRFICTRPLVKDLIDWPVFRIGGADESASPIRCVVFGVCVSVQPCETTCVSCACGEHQVHATTCQLPQRFLSWHVSERSMNRPRSDH